MKARNFVREASGAMNTVVDGTAFSNALIANSESTSRRPKARRIGLPTIFFPLLRSRHLCAFVILTAGLLGSGIAVAAPDSFIVSTTAGELRGIPRAGGGAQFLGIPYAEPPLGNLRWRAPVPVAHWTGVRNAGAYGVPCVQPDLGEWNRGEAALGREDCLYLNVDVPIGRRKRRCP